MSSLEIEIKAFCDHIDDIRNRIKDMGASFLGILHEKDTYFNHPSRDFSKTDEALRIRRSGDLSVITYKGPKLSDRAKTRYEREVPVDDPEGLEDILIKLGFINSGSVSKEREEYMLNDILVCLDTVEILGTFVELEILSDDREDAEKKLFSLAETLGLSDFTMRSYLEMVIENQ